MRTMLKGALAAAVLLGGGAALADDPQKQQGQMGQMGQMEMGQPTELTGTVIKGEKTTLYVRSEQGAAIPLKIEKSTKFDDPKVKSSHDLKPGQEVRASYTVKGTENVAKEVFTKEGKGGAGMEGTDKGINEPVYPEPNGTGGSGTHPGTGGSGTPGSLEPQPIEPAPAPGDVNHPVDMQKTE